MTSTIPSTRGTSSSANADNPDLVEMAWDPITRIVGSLGIYTKIDFKSRTSPSATAPARSSAATRSS